jgi:hypothetical protein
MTNSSSNQRNIPQRAVTAATHSLRSMITSAFEFGFGDNEADMKNQKNEKNSICSLSHLPLFYKKLMHFVKLIKG